MLGRIITKQLQNNIYFKRLAFKFSSGGHDIQHHNEHSDHHDNHDHHDHHDYSVHIDKDATWIKYNGDPRLMYVLGLQNTNADFKNQDFSDPFTHIKQNPIFSLQNLAYNDPYYHEDQHQALVNEEHGYNFGDDPIDNRWDIVYPFVLTACTFLTIFSIYFYLQATPLQQAETRMQVLATNYVQKELEQKNEELNKIRDRIRQISKKNETV